MSADRPLRGRGHRELTQSGSVEAQLRPGSVVYAVPGQHKMVSFQSLEALPMHRPGMHRCIPALLLLHGARSTQLPVNHRIRSIGRSK